MLGYDVQQPVFRALADPTRRAILDLLHQGPLAMTEIAGQFEMSRPAVAKHLHVLQEGGLISIEKIGRQRMNRLNPVALKSAVDWLNRFDTFWDEQLSVLKKAAEADQ